MIDLDKLEELCKNATPGPWLQGTYNGDIMPWVCDDSGVEIARTSLIRAVDEDHIQNAAHISSANPTTILELITEVRRLRLEVDRLKELNLSYHRTIPIGAHSEEAK